MQLTSYHNWPPRLRKSASVLYWLKCYRVEHTNLTFSSKKVHCISIGANKAHYALGAQSSWEAPGWTPPNSFHFSQPGQKRVRKKVCDKSQWLQRTYSHTAWRKSTKAVAISHFWSDNSSSSVIHYFHCSITGRFATDCSWLCCGWIRNQWAPFTIGR